MALEQKKKKEAERGIQVMCTRVQMLKNIKGRAIKRSEHENNKWKNKKRKLNEEFR